MDVNELDVTDDEEFESVKVKKTRMVFVFVVSFARHQIPIRPPLDVYHAMIWT